MNLLDEAQSYWSEEAKSLSSPALCIWLALLSIPAFIVSLAGVASAIADELERRRAAKPAKP